MCVCVFLKIVTFSCLWMGEIFEQRLPSLGRNLHTASTSCFGACSTAYLGRERVQGGLEQPKVERPREGESVTTGLSVLGSSKTLE